MARAHGAQAGLARRKIPKRLLDVGERHQDIGSLALCEAGFNELADEPAASDPDALGLALDRLVQRERRLDRCIRHGLRRFVSYGAARQGRADGVNRYCLVMVDLSMAQARWN